MNPPRRTIAANQQYGRLTTLEPGTHSRALVTCRCTCGTIDKFQVYALTTGNTRSCGCLRADRAAMQAAHASSHAATERALQRHRQDAA